MKGVVTAGPINGESAEPIAALIMSLRRLNSIQLVLNVAMIFLIKN